MQPPYLESQLSNEARLIIAIQALENNPNLGEREAARQYGVSRSTLGRRRDGTTARRDSTPNCRIFTAIEEQVLVDRILELDARGFPPTKLSIRTMANTLRRQRGKVVVGTNWVDRFIKRRSEVKSRWSRSYDNQRAKQEDPTVIGAWFKLVAGIKEKYGIVDEDTYNFDESGFLMGIIGSQLVVTASERRGRPKLIQPGDREWITVIQGICAAGWAIPPFVIYAGKMHISTWYEDASIPRDWVIAVSENGWTSNKLGLAWLKHFDAHTKGRVKGTHRLLVIDGHESHNSIEFQDYCAEHKIITICMPPHSSHLLQPLDVGCFSPLKRAYGDEISAYMRRLMTHITKIEFLPAFKSAFLKAFTKENIKGAFRGAGLVPLDAEVVLQHLDVRLRTPTPPTYDLPTWESKTPYNVHEFEAQSTLVRKGIRDHLNSSPSSTMQVLEKLEKGALATACSHALILEELAGLRKTIEETTKRKSRKRKYIQSQGTLTVAEGSQLAAEKRVGGQKKGKQPSDRGAAAAGPSTTRRCGKCGETGHNARTCRKVEEEASESEASTQYIFSSSDCE